MRAAAERFPWTHEPGCGCVFSRVVFTDGSEERFWDPCGTHIVLAAQQVGWLGRSAWPPDDLPPTVRILSHS